jgi:hypothetical protein
MVELLHNLTTDFSDPTQAEEPLRQLLANTHSPVLVGQLVNQLDSPPGMVPGLLFAYMTTRVQPSQAQPLRVSRIVPVVQPDKQLKRSLGIEAQEEAYTLSQATEYLNSADLDEALAGLRGEPIR